MLTDSTQQADSVTLYLLEALGSFVHGRWRGEMGDSIGSDFEAVVTGNISPSDMILEYHDPAGGLCRVAGRLRFQQPMDLRRSSAVRSNRVGGGSDLLVRISRTVGDHIRGWWNECPLVIVEMTKPPQEEYSARDSRLAIRPRFPTDRSRRTGTCRGTDQRANGSAVRRDGSAVRPAGDDAGGRSRQRLPADRPTASLGWTFEGNQDGRKGSLGHQVTGPNPGMPAGQMDLNPSGPLTASKAECHDSPGVVAEE